MRWPTPTCSPGRAAPARRAPRASSPRPSTAWAPMTRRSSGRRPRPAASAATAWPSPAASRSMSSRWTPPPTAASTTSATCARRSPSPPSTAVSRCTSSTRFTCSRAKRSTRCSRPSRCQRFDFRRPQVRDIARLLATIVERENARPDDERGGPRIEIQEAALEEIARHSQGGFRDAIGTLDKLITYSDGAIKPADVLEALGVTDADLLFEITDVVTERRTAEALQFVQRLANDGTDYSQFIRDLLRHLRQLFLLQHLEASSRDDASLRALGQTVELDDQLLSRLLPQANNLPPREVVHFIETLGEAQREIRDGLDPRLQLELALVKVT